MLRFQLNQKDWIKELEDSANALLNWFAIKLPSHEIIPNKISIA